MKSAGLTVNADFYSWLGPPKKCRIKYSRPCRVRVKHITVEYRGGGDIYIVGRWNSIGGEQQEKQFEFGPPPPPLFPTPPSVMDTSGWYLFISWRAAPLFDFTVYPVYEMMLGKTNEPFQVIVICHWQLRLDTILYSSWTSARSELYSLLLFFLAKLYIQVLRLKISIEFANGKTRISGSKTIRIVLKSAIDSNKRGF